MTLVWIWLHIMLFSDIKSTDVTWVTFKYVPGLVNGLNRIVSILMIDVLSSVINCLFCNFWYVLSGDVVYFCLVLYYWYINCQNHILSQCEMYPFMGTPAFYSQASLANLNHFSIRTTTYFLIDIHHSL